MAFANSDARLPSNSSRPSSAPTIQNPPVAPYSGPRFADFQFRTIGQQPELLKRISAPNPDTHYEHDTDLLSPSFVSPDQPIRTLSPPESDSAKRPSLRDRLSLIQFPAIGRDENVDVTMVNPLEKTPAFDSRMVQSIDVSPMATSTTQAHSHHVNSFTPQGPSPISSEHGTLGKESDLSPDMISVPSSVESRFPIITRSETEAHIPPPTSTQASGTSGVSTLSSSGETVHSLMALRTLQSRLSSSLSNFNPISTANALATAQSAKDQCTEILAAAHRAHTLAQQASLLAQDSLVAAQECLNIAATVQKRADLALSAVEKIRSGQGTGGGEWEYNATVTALKDDLHQLAEWVSQRDVYESKCLRQLEEREVEKPKKKSALHKLKFSADKQSHDLIARNEFSGIQIGIHEAGVTTVEDEADAATRAWNQHCEQSAERKRLAEDESRKRREAEAELERQKLEAQSEVEAREAELEKLRAERLQAEEEEKSRQEKESFELQRQQQEIARFLRSQKQVQDDLTKVATEEKKKAQAAEAEKEARLIAEHEQKRMEIPENELLNRRHDAEKAKRREVLLERMKCPVVEAQPSASVDTVVNILDKAKEKQSMATLIPLSQHAPSLSPPTHRASALDHAEFGNIVSKKTLLTNGAQTSMQHNRTSSGSIKLDEPTNPINPTSSISSILISLNPMQKDAKSDEVIPNIPLSIDKRSSSHTHEVDRKSVCNIGSSKLPSSPSSPLTPLSGMNPSPPVSSSPHLPPATNPNDFEDIHLDIDIHSNGPDVGNVSFFPLSRVLPVSLEAQRANLRPFMDANGITSGPGASDANEQKAFSSSGDWPSATDERSRRKPLSSSQMNGDQTCRTSSSNLGSVKLKLEPDVPVLSMPSPPPAIIKAAPTCVVPTEKPKLPDLKKIKEVLSTAASEASLALKELSASAQTMPSFAQPPELANSSILLRFKENARPAAVRRNVPPLTSNEQSSTLADTFNQTFQADDSHLPISSRMGPDAAVTDGWAQPTADDSMAKKQRKQLPRSISSVSRFPPKRPRVPSRITNDHYSPPRYIPDSLPSHYDYARDRRRSGSAECTRGLSPQTNYNEVRNSLSPDDMSTVGRKRYRDGDPVDAPPPRRYRYDSPPLRQDDYVQPSSCQPPGADWSRTAIYARSPSPEPRTTPLALRLESERPWNSQGGSSYRPIYSDSNSYAHDSQSRHAKNQRYSALHSQSIPQSSSYYSDASAQSNQQRQFGRNDITNDTRLPLLSRFTDSTEQTLPPLSNQHGPARPRMPKGRGGGNQALEQRISKPKSVSLINRLEDVN